MVVGKVPFYSDEIIDYYSLASNKEVSYPKFLSESLVDLLMRLLQKNPSKRFTIEEIKNHKWFKNEHIFKEVDDTKKFIKIVKLIVIPGLLSLQNISHIPQGSKQAECKKCCDTDGADRSRVRLFFCCSKSR